MDLRRKKTKNPLSGRELVAKGGLHGAFKKSIYFYLACQPLHPPPPRLEFIHWI